MKPIVRVEVFANGKVITTTNPETEELFTFRWYLDKQSFVEGLMARITTEQMVPVTVEPRTARGAVAPIDGDVELTVSDPSVVTVERVSATSFNVKGILTAAVGAIPVAVQVVASFDADLGTGVVPVELSGVLEVASPQATTGVLVFGTPVVQP